LPTLPTTLPSKQRLSPSLTAKRIEGPSGRPGGPFLLFNQSGTLIEMRRSLLLAASLLIACNREEQPQSPTTAESERLNDAEAMLNTLANEEGAAPEDTAPSNQSN
jgi:hypothetical protein